VPHHQGEAAVGHHLTKIIGMTISILCFTGKGRFPHQHCSSGHVEWS